MEKRDNYQIQARQAKEIFLQYDQQRLIEKLKLRADEAYLYPALFDRQYRIHRKTGDMEWLDGQKWSDGNSFHEVLTMMDLICDSREDRYLTGRWRNMTDFGHQFHQNLMEDEKNPFAWKIQQNPAAFRRACEAMNGKPVRGADIAYSIPVFDGLPIGLFFWEGDDEFSPRLRYFWDENALMYIRYETMYYAVHLLESRLEEIMR